MPLWLWLPLIVLLYAVAARCLVGMQPFCAWMPGLLLALVTSLAVLSVVAFVASSLSPGGFMTCHLGALRNTALSLAVVAQLSALAYLHRCLRRGLGAGLATGRWWLITLVLFNGLVALAFVRAATTCAA